MLRACAIGRTAHEPMNSGQFAARRSRNRIDILGWPMKLRFDGVISEDGGFADIWLAYDATERKVAVKIVRESSVEISDALAHARALVRAAHKNIVTVFAVTDVEDPGRPGTYAPAIIMEYLSGETLYDAMLSRKFSDMEVLKISIGLIDAVRHIHKSGLVHGDLHEKNIMLVAGEVKVIDLLYRYSLLSVDSAKNAELQRREVDSVSRLIAELATKSSLDPSLIATFMRNEQKSQSLDMLASAVWQLCGAPIVAPSLTSLTSEAATVPIPLSNPQFHSAALLPSPAADEIPTNKSNQGEEAGAITVTPITSHLTIVNRGLIEIDSSHIATVTLVTDEPMVLHKCIEQIKHQLKQDILIEKTSITPNASLVELLNNSGTRPRLLEWLATTPFAAHLYFAARTAIEDNATWTKSKLRTEFIALPIVHRLSNKSIKVEKMASSIADAASCVDEALAHIKSNYHRTISPPSWGQPHRSPDKSLLELADLVISCCLMYLRSPGDDLARATFAHVRTRLKYAVNVPSLERHTRDRNPLP